MKGLLIYLKDPRIQVALFSGSLQLIGYTFLVIYFGWLLAAILFVILWGNNIQMSQKK